MSDVPLGTLEAVAARAARAGGDYLRGEFRTGPVDAEYGPDDVKAAVDREAERRVRAVLTDAVPDHTVVGEELEPREGTGHEWVVDPLDGTNNFVAGLPTFATAVAVLDGDGVPQVAAVYEPLPDSLYLARRGGGATVNGRPLDAGSDRPLDSGTVSFVVGLEAVRDESLAADARRIATALRERSKRVVETWAPTVDWGLLARGGIDGLVGFHPDRYERHAGALLARESGASTHESGGRYVAAGDDATRDELLAVVDAVA